MTKKKNGKQENGMPKSSRQENGEQADGHEQVSGPEGTDGQKPSLDEAAERVAVEDEKVDEQVVELGGADGQAPGPANADGQAPSPKGNAHFEEGSSSKHRRLGKGRIAAVVVGALVLVSLACFGIWRLGAVNGLANNFDGTVPVSSMLQGLPLGSLQVSGGSPTEPVAAGDPYYVLVLGSDNRQPGVAGRSDAIILCRIDPAKKQVSLLSIPRDTRVDLPGHGKDKINAAMIYGGPKEAVKAVSDFVGVPIAHYVQMDFTGFKDIVNALGGVTVDVPAYTYYDGIAIQAGKQKLNGEQALIFARCRKTYGAGDFQRTANHRQLIKVVADDLLRSPATSMPELITTISKYLNTDMSTDQIIAMVQSLRGMSASTDIYTGQVPSVSTFIAGGSYVVPVDDQWASVKKKFIAGKVPFVADSEKIPGVIE